MLTPEQYDAVTELINIGVGRAAASLNQLVDAHVQLTVPQVAALRTDELEDTLTEFDDGPVSSVQLSFTGMLQGCALLLFPPASALHLVQMMVADESPDEDLDSIRAGTLSEVGNILINGVIGAISNCLERPLRFCLPQYAELPLPQLLTTRRAEQTELILLARTRFRVSSLEIEGNILLLFELDSFESLMESVRRAWIGMEQP